MKIWMWVAAGTGLGLAAVWFGRHWLLHRSDTQRPAAPMPVARNRPPRRPKQYYGVSVKADLSACEAVDALRNRRFLLEEAPRFPLPGCSNERCRCVAVPEDDRRAPQGDRRSRTFTAYGDYNPNAYYEKREAAKRGRRELDPVG